MSLCKKLLSITAFLGMITYFGVVSAVAANTAVVSADVVNVRSGPSLNDDIIEKAYDGQTISPLSVNGDWYLVDTPTAKGVYINREFVSVTSADGVVNADSVNIRSQASTSSDILGQADTGMKLSVTGQEGDFYIFTYNGQKSYIHKDFVDGDLLKYVEKKTAKPAASNTSSSANSASNTSAASPVPAASQAEVPTANEAAKETTYALVLSETGLNLRRSPSQDGEIIIALSYSEAVDVLEIGSQWHKVSYEGMIGYISADFSMVKTGVKPDTSVRTSLVNYAKQFLGTKYVWGGTNLKTGVDCSGFTYSVYKNFGITLNRSSRDQLSNGRRVDRAELVPGDLVFFDTNGGSNNGNISHVGIYIGDGNFIHASSSSKSPYVTISSLWEDYYTRRYVAACRVL